jgi:CRISPR system Cascade subunit CasB
MSKIDFVELRQRYERLPNGPKADLRRLTEPSKAAEIAAAYRLLPGLELKVGLRRVLFCLPWVRHAEGASTLGASLSKAGVNEKRLFQVIRSESPNDIVQLRRLLQWAEPVADWRSLGKQLLYWGDADKRRLLENYYFAWNEAAQV